MWFARFVSRWAFRLRSQGAMVHIDYLAFGPIYSTKTKTNPDPTVGLEQLSAVKFMAGDVPVVAIGGIRDSCIRDVLMAGADSVAVISALLAESAHIAEKLRNLTNKAENLS